ncbi:igE-binding protein-like [Phocoena sinus]|uniref:igE-binding protein-like n=1 Tax=Phocoena sinus TaxID=42100 RepID=UPI0013C3EC35|nr:igE-binding protein-like [Phocoena sinus]
MADTVATILLQHVIPRFGLPVSIQSDNGPAFVSQMVQQVSEALQITWKLHIPYHPQSSGFFAGAWRKSLGWPQTKCSSALTPCFLQNPPLVSPKPRTSGCPTPLLTPPFSMK